MRSLITVIGALCLSAQSPPTASVGFGGAYVDLRPEQKRLVDDWFARFSAVVKKPVDPAEGYENLPLSTKTTFNAVTHALLNTSLTSESGQVLAMSALELVEKVDSAAGEIFGARGDEQFRIYVQLSPNALELLNLSQEFKHTVDNTVYHKGYPTCYRTKGVPSIQISLTRDASLADIDVDYRSAKFPVALLNGHLTASNSDVRAGDNDARHNNQWAGLQNWWRNLLGLPLNDQPAQMEGKVLAQEPPRKNMKAGDAVYDFLNTWLIKQEPNEAFGYFSDEAFFCLELRENRDRGMSKFILVENMLEVDSRIGHLSNLKEASTAVSLSNERLKPVDQPHGAEFALYKVREDLAEEFRCANHLDSAAISAKAAKSHDFGKYIGAVFRIQTGNVVATLWRKDHGYWKLISYEVDPQVGRSAAPNAGLKDVTPPPLQVVEGDPELVKAASLFFDLWFVKKDVEKALRYVAPECLPCIRLYRADEAGSTTDRDALKAGMINVATHAGSVKKLEEAIIAPEVHHPDLKLVLHRESRAFAVASMPEYMAEAARCDHRDAEGNPSFVGGPATGYGKYYATGLSLNQGADAPAVLWIVWSKDSGFWKAISYVLLTP